MEIKLLPKSLRETLRSEVNIRSVAKCIAQLVFNSIDANSASIAIRVNLVTFKIQVIDNGTGISKRNLKLVGFRYATSKYYSIEDLEKNPNIFPSRGEALASIIKLSKTVKITTRTSDNSKTFCKVFENGKSLSITSIKQRPSKGTTIIIENFMYNLPVRKKMINQNNCLDEIKNEIEYIALIHPNTSFSLRNDTTGEIIFHTYRSKYVFQTTAILYGKEFSRQLRKICYNDRNFSISGLISLNSHAQNKIQFVYINSRFVPKTKIHTLINTLISKSKIIKNKETKPDSPMMKQKHAAFIINIKCSYTELDIVDYIEPEIEFKNWEIVLSCVEKAILRFLKANDLIEVKETKTNDLQNGSPLKESAPNVRTSQVAGVIRGIPIKRKLPNSEQIEQSISILSSDKSVNNKQIKVVADVHLPPKKNCNEISVEKLPSPLIQKPENNKKANEHNVTLESNSECGKDIIMDMFLKSTRVFRNDEELKNDDLLTFKSAEKYNNRSSSTCYVSTLKNNCKKTSVTSTKISITKTIEQNINSNNNIENNNNNNVFKVPLTPKLKLPKRKHSTTNDSINVSNILERNKIAENENKEEIYQNIGLPKNFQLDLIKNISERNRLPPNITNRFSKLINNFTKEPKHNNYECTIKITKRLNYLQSSDFLQPAIKRVKYIQCRNKNLKHFKKETVHANSMIKTYYDLKNNMKNHQMMNNNNYKIHHNYLSYLKNQNNVEPSRFSYKNERDNVLPIYNIKRNHNYYRKNNNHKINYYEPKHKIVDRINYVDNNIHFPNPQLLFKPFSTNPNLNNLFSKNNIGVVKPNIYSNYNFLSPNICFENRNKNEFNSDTYKASTFNSHTFIKDCKYKQNVEPNSNYINETAVMYKKPKNYFDLTNKQNEFKLFEFKKKNKISESVFTETSDITFLPEIISVPKETSVKIAYNKERNIENMFSNYFQNQITPENNNYKYHDNIKTKYTVESNITFLSESVEVSETPIQISCNKQKDNVNLECQNTFSNYFPNRNIPENNHIKKYDDTNISNSVGNTKKNIQSSISFTNELNSSPKEIQQNVSCNIINNSTKDIDNIQKSNDIKNSENLNTSNDMNMHTFSNNNSIETETVNKKKNLSLFSSNYSSPIISDFTKRKITTNIHEYQENKSNNEQSNKDSSIISSPKFSTTSNLIQEKDISNILNALDQSIMSDTLKISYFEKRSTNNNLNGTHPTHDLQLLEKKSNIISGTNSVFPVFQEDSSNIVLENTKNIDAILKLPLSNDTIIQTNLSNIQQENNSEIHNKNYETTNNLQSNSNSLSKNAKESNENINQVVAENDEYENQMSEWIKQTSETGNSYYLNLRTGMTSFGTPRNINGCLVTKRHSFMPKGMSPIMLPTSTIVTKELSPKSKSVLHQTIANTENDELQTVKWINFLKNKDSQKFFNELYCASKNYETEIPNINKYKLPKKITAGFENYSFSKDDFNNVTVINQCDNKFIVTKIEIQGKYDLLVLFDQHAVHERIRLEKLLKDYEEVDNKLKSIKCKTAIRLTLDDYEISMLQNYKNNFENWGLFYEIKDEENVIFLQIPLCWQTKDDSNLKHKEYSIIESLIMALIQEESNWLRNIRAINVALPLAIQNTIKSEACRTAIKFGDPLSKEQCENLIKELLLCDLPFNCAHGRPTIVPIIDLNNINNEDEDEEINLNKLKT